MLTQEYLKSILSYDPETGLFTDIKTKKIIGKKYKSKYVFIYISNKNHYAHRLAWLYVHGNIPKNCIDHIDGIKYNNKISNLREATSAQNSQNIKKAHSSNKSTGLLGVHLRKDTGKFQVRIDINNKQKYIGNFKTKEEAHEAYVKAKRKYHEFNTL